MVDSQAAGRSPPAEPTATYPLVVAVTAFIPSPVPGRRQARRPGASWARCPSRSGPLRTTPPPPPAVARSGVVPGDHVPTAARRDGGARPALPGDAARHGPGARVGRGGHERAAASRRAWCRRPASLPGRARPRPAGRCRPWSATQARPSVARVQVAPPSAEDPEGRAAVHAARRHLGAARTRRSRRGSPATSAAAPAKLAPASRAGGNPAASADGADAPLPPPPVTTTTAMPTATAARIGTARPISQFRLRMTERTPLLASRTDDRGACSGCARWSWRKRVMPERVPRAARMTRAARHLELVAWNLASVHSVRA